MIQLLSTVPCTLLCLCLSIRTLSSFPSTATGPGPPVVTHLTVHHPNIYIQIPSRLSARGVKCPPHTLFYPQLTLEKIAWIRRSSCPFPHVSRPYLNHEDSNILQVIFTVHLPTRVETSCGQQLIDGEWRSRWKVIDQTPLPRPGTFIELKRETLLHFQRVVSRDLPTTSSFPKRRVRTTYEAPSGDVTRITHVVGSGCHSTSVMDRRPSYSVENTNRREVWKRRSRLRVVVSRLKRRSRFHIVVGCPSRGSWSLPAKSHCSHIVESFGKVEGYSVSTWERLFQT